MLPFPPSRHATFSFVHKLSLSQQSLACLRVLWKPSSFLWYCRPRIWKGPSPMYACRHVCTSPACRPDVFLPPDTLARVHSRKSSMELVFKGTCRQGMRTGRNPNVFLQVDMIWDRSFHPENQMSRDWSREKSHVLIVMSSVRGETFCLPRFTPNP